MALFFIGTTLLENRVDFLPLAKVRFSESLMRGLTSAGSAFTIFVGEIFAIDGWDKVLPEGGFFVWQLPRLMAKTSRIAWR